MDACQVDSTPGEAVVPRVSLQAQAARTELNLHVVLVEPHLVVGRAP